MLLLPYPGVLFAGQLVAMPLGNHFRKLIYACQVTDASMGVLIAFLHGILQQNRASVPNILFRSLHYLFYAEATGNG